MGDDSKAWTLKESLGLGAMLSVPALMITLPIGFAGGSWRWPVIIHATILALSVVGWLIARLTTRYRAAAITTGLVGWLAGVALGVALVVFGITLLVDNDADCVPSETVTCRAVSDTGQDLGEVSESDQEQRNAIIAFIPIVPGAMLLLLMGRAGYRYVSARRR
jgi:ABC-type uncharacterized transport system permease subunit